MALKPVTVGSQTVYVDDKNNVYTGTPDYGAHGDNALSSNLFKKTNQTLDSYRAAQSANQEQDYLNRFTNAIASRPSLSQLSSTIEQDYGIPKVRENYTGLSDLVGSLTNQVRALPTQVQGETRGFDVNANQLSQITQARQQPLLTNLSEAGTNLSSVGNTLNMLNSALGQRLGYEVQDRADQLLPFQAEGSLLSDRLAREAAQYSQDDQQEFDMLLEKMKQGNALTAAETARANQLADSETEFERQKELIKLNTNENIRQSNATKTGSGLGSTTEKLLEEYIKNQNSRGTVNTPKPSLNSIYNVG